MTWTGRRREGWVQRKALERRSDSTESARTSQPTTTSPQPLPVSVPAFPCFSPAAVAQVLGTSRQNVHYWLQAGKLECYRDNLKEPYVLRAELVRFIREYLQRPMADIESQSSR